LEWKLGNRI